MRINRKRVSETVLQFDSAWVARCAQQTETEFGLSDRDSESAQRKALYRAVRRVWKTELTPCQREYFRAYYFEHLTMRAIAARWGVTESTVSRTLLRARRRLQRYLVYYDTRLQKEKTR